MVNAGERSSNEIRKESESALMPKRLAKRSARCESNEPSTEAEHRQPGIRGREKVLPSITLPRFFGDPRRGIRLPAPQLEGESTVAIAYDAVSCIQEVAARVQYCCSQKKKSGKEKELPARHLIIIASEATLLLNELARAFQQTFRTIAEDLSVFPCMFPAHSETLRSLEKWVWNDLNLGKNHNLKLRPRRGRKTFSYETWANQLLLRYIYFINMFAEMAGFNDAEFASFSFSSALKRFVAKVPLTPKNAKQWLDTIWDFLLVEIPEPETHPRLRQLGGRPSKVHDVRGTIKAKLGTYLERMLNDQAVHK